MSVNFVTATAVKSFDVPDKKRCPDKAEFDLVTVNDYSVARLILDPGWRWSECIKPFEKTDFCQHNHLGFCVSGVMEVETSDGVHSTIHANDTRDALTRLEMMVMMAGYEMPVSVIRQYIGSAITLVVQVTAEPPRTEKLSAAPSDGAV